MDLDINQTKELIKQCITIFRKNGDPAYPHSRSVGDRLLRNGFSDDIVIAGLLHDIIEDSHMTFESLQQLGYCEYILTIVDYVTHDDSICDGDKKWDKMMGRCICSASKDVRAVKIADFRDNICDFKGCSRQFMEKMLFKRGPLFIYYGNAYFAGTAFYNDFLNEYREQVKLFYEYDF